MGRRQLYIGEVGMYEGVIFIETTQMPHLNAEQIKTKYGSGGSIQEAYEAVFFGENAYAWGVALDVELRDDGVVDMGRKHTLGWYVFGEPESLKKRILSKLSLYNRGALPT